MQQLILLFNILAIALGYPGQERIINGQNTTIDKYPYQGSLRYDGRHFCGCSLLNPQAVLTAAHCTNGPEVDHLTVHFGSSRYYDEVGQIVKVREVRQHPDFKPNSMDYDVSILILDHMLQVGPYVQAVPMTTKEPEAGEVAVVTGWGLLKEGSDELPEILQKLEVPIYNRGSCNSVYQGKITIRMLCAGYEAGGKDACAGDSGGPLVLNGKQVGIVSWGNGCAHPFYVGIYTNVAQVNDWIQENKVVDN